MCGVGGVRWKDTPSNGSHGKTPSNLRHMMNSNGFTKQNVWTPSQSIHLSLKTKRDGVFGHTLLPSVRVASGVERGGASVSPQGSTIVLTTLGTANCQNLCRFDVAQRITCDPAGPFARPNTTQHCYDKYGGMCGGCMLQQPASSLVDLTVVKRKAFESALKCANIFRKLQVHEQPAVRRGEGMYVLCDLLDDL
jgi:hypothetical protein